jgi:MerR family mercuric resistance operon transcriptional regulator
MSKTTTITRAAQFAIGELSRQTAVLIETIRYYERIGFLPVPERGTNGRRTYNIEDVKRLRFIKRSRDMGFSQDEVRALLRLADGGARSCGEVQALAETHLRDIRSKIRDLRKMELILATTVSKCTGEGAPACPVLDALSAKRV